MEPLELEALVKEIIKQAKELKDSYTREKTAQVNYSAIFSHSQAEYNELIETAKKVGKVVDNTPTGPLFHIKPIATIAGSLKLLKIRAPDQTRPERGDADFTVSNYHAFKDTYLTKQGFKLIERKNMEMIELAAPGSNVRVYFSNPPLDKQLGI